MKTTAMLLAIALGAGGCAQVHGFLAERRAEGASEELKETCKAAEPKSIDDYLCDELGLMSTHQAGELPPIVKRAGELKSMEGSDPQLYARTLDVDLDELDHTLAASTANRDLAKQFVLAVKWRVDDIGKRVAAQPEGWRDVYVQPVLAAREAWAAGAARRAPWLAKLAPLAERDDAVGVSSRKDPKLVDEMIALQRAYVADCHRARVAMEECLGDEVTRPLTRRIVRLAWASGDHDLATAENAVFSVPDGSELRYAVRHAEVAAVAAARADRAAWEKAKAAGRSDDALRARWPVEPIAIDDTELAGEEPPEGADNVIQDDNDSYWVPKSRAQVARVVRSGDRATISFRRNVQTVATQYNCHETNRVDSISDDGHINYREECGDDVPMERQDLTPKPISVPWVEAQALRPMDVVTFVDDPHGQRTHVVEVQVGDASLSTMILHDDVIDTPRLQIVEYRLEVARPPEAKAARKPR